MHKKNFLDDLWDEIKPIVKHTIVYTVLTLPIIFFTLVVNPFLPEPMHSIAIVLETIYFTCTLSLYTYLAIVLVFRFVRKTLKGDNDNNNEADDQERNINLSSGKEDDSKKQETKPKTLNPIPTSANKVEEIKNNTGINYRS